jgi:integrase/recombinase XerD
MRFWERSHLCTTFPTHCGSGLTGPLLPYVSVLVDELASLGYTRTSATAQMQLAAHLSRWLAAEGKALSDVTSEVIDLFLLERRRSFTSHYSKRSLAPTLSCLRRLGVLPAARPIAAPEDATDVLLDRFSRYLASERALTAPVVRAYAHWVRPFVTEVLCAGGVERVGDLGAAEVAAYLATRLPALSRKSAQMSACALRSLLRFLHSRSMVPADLSGVVPPVALWRLSGLPKALSAQEIAALLDACDRSDPTGMRDVAMITMMCRLGLRCAEIADLRLDDIDWSGGTFTVRGKAGRTDRMPLPQDVGQALVDYLKARRPTIGSRSLFVRVRAPFTPLQASSVSCVVARAARRAGLGTVHGHRLRHTAATETLNAGATLEEVAQLMRHEGISTTVIYAKTDRNRLANLARPWPSTEDAR